MNFHYSRAFTSLAALALVAVCLGTLAGGSLGLEEAQANAGGGDASPNLNQHSRQGKTNILSLRVYFRTANERDSLMAEFGLEEWSPDNSYLTVWADQTSYDGLLARGLRVEIEPALTYKANSIMASGALRDSRPETFYGGYKTTEETEAFLDRYAGAYPALSEKVDVGDSWCKSNPGACTLPEPYSGYDIWAMHITNR